MEIIVWLALIIFFVVLEIATVGLTSIWLAGGSLAGLICAAFGMGITGQIIVFAANVCVTEQIDNVRGTGTAVMNGLEWTARSVDDEKTFEPGMIVMVKEIKGVTLYVTESSDMPQMNGDK